MKIQCVYLITNKINNKKYVGWTSNFHNRMIKHFAKCKSNCILIHNAVQKYGKDNFNVEILFEFDDCELLKKIEQFYIGLYNSHYSNGFGYNLTYGGEGTIGPKTEEHKKKLSESGKKYFSNIKNRLNASKIAKNIWQRDGYKDKMVKLHTKNIKISKDPVTRKDGYIISLDTRKKLSDAQKNRQLKKLAIEIAKGVA